LSPQKSSPVGFTKFQIWGGVSAEAFPPASKKSARHRSRANRKSNISSRSSWASLSNARGGNKTSGSMGRIVVGEASRSIPLPYWMSVSTKKRTQELEVIEARRFETGLSHSWKNYNQYYALNAFERALLHLKGCRIVSHTIGHGGGIHDKQKTRLRERYSTRFSTANGKPGTASLGEAAGYLKVALRG